jgi:hypothetical protein
MHGGAGPIARLAPRCRPSQLGLTASSTALVQIVVGGLGVVRNAIGVQTVS